MSVLPLTELAPRVDSGEALLWRSPLGQSDAIAVLEGLGAEASLAEDGAPRAVLAALDDPFCSSLCFVARPGDRGTLIEVSVFGRGFGHEFDLAVRGGLTVFALGLLAYAGAGTSGRALLTVMTAVGLGWSVLMGTYFALRWIMTRLGGYQQAVDSACARARGALFAQRA